MAKSVTLILLQWHKVFLDLAGILRRQERLSCTDSADSPHYSVIEHLLLLVVTTQHRILAIVGYCFSASAIYNETPTFRAESGYICFKPQLVLHTVH